MRLTVEMLAIVSLICGWMITAQRNDRLDSEMIAASS